MHSIAEKLFPQVKHLVDAEDPVTVEVKGGDIRGATIKDPANCAVARACKREYDLDGAVITVSTAYLIKGDTAYRYCVPRAVAMEAVVFDRGGAVKNGTFELTPYSRKCTLEAKRARRLNPAPPTRKRHPRTERNQKIENIRKIPTLARVGG